MIKKRLGKPLTAVMTVADDTNTISAAISVPVATVLGATHNLAAHMPSNASNVIEGDSDSDMLVSGSTPIATVALEVRDEDIAPFTVPHFFWSCSVNGLANDFPTFFQVLINHGLHTVLINDKFTTSLSLKHRKLVKPMPVESVKQNVFLSEWENLKLYDPSGTWKSRTVHAIIAPSLCVPVILGGLSLAHNNIVVDHAACTAIDKISGFDLLNLSLPLSLPPRKKKLKEFFRDLQEDRKLMIAKMVCAERKCQLRNQFQIQKPVVAAVHLCIETLA
jgi:hypothetical protein